MLMELVLEKVTECCETLGLNVGKKAAEGRAMREVSAPEECHKGGGKRREALKEGLQGRLSATGVAKENGKEVDDIIVTSAAASETNLVAERVEELALGEMARQDNDLGEPRWDGRHILWGSVNINGRCMKCRHSQLLKRNSQRLLSRSIVDEWKAPLPCQANLVAHLVGGGYLF